MLGANDKVNIGIVGIGGRGNDHIKSYATLPDARIVALCDVNQAALETGQAAVKKLTGEQPKGYDDMRKLFADKDVDAVSIATPNHWHALATIWACQAGKDVYCEKPACHNVYEGERMIEAARKYQPHGADRLAEPQPGLQDARPCSYLHEGVIGKVYMAKGLCFKRRPSIGHADDAPVPPGVDWDKFLGPAPMRPFNALRFKYNWHWFWDTGNGDIGNQGVHEMDIARWGLGEVTLAEERGLHRRQVRLQRRPGDAQHPDRHLRLRRRGNCSSKCAASLPAVRAASSRAAATTSAISSTAPMAG